MFLFHRTQEAAPQDDLRELTDIEQAEVAGGVMCTRVPAEQTVMWIATGLLPEPQMGRFSAGDDRLNRTQPV